MKDSFLCLLVARSLQTRASFCGDPVPQTILFYASVANRFSSDPNPKNVLCPLGQSFGMFGNT